MGPDSKLPSRQGQHGNLRTRPCIQDMLIAQVQHNHGNRAGGKRKSSLTLAGDEQQSGLPLLSRDPDRQTEKALLRGGR